MHIKPIEHVINFAILAGAFLLAAAIGAAIGWVITLFGVGSWIIKLLAVICGLLAVGFFLLLANGGPQ